MTVESRMRRFVFLLLAGLLGACAGPGSGPVAVTSPTTAATATTAPPSPTPIQVACELPFLTVNSNEVITQVGFLKLPDGVFRPDATASSSLPPGGVQSPPDPGGTQPWWDAQARRWVPVALSSVSPDGQSYVYMSANGLHRVLVATGVDTLVYREPKGVRGGQVLAYQAVVYIEIPTAVKAGAGAIIANPRDQVGVWKIDVVRGTGARVLASDTLGWLAGGALWITPPIENTVGDSLVRVDLGTRQQAVWFNDPGRAMQFLGFDHDGLPIVWTFADGHLEIWRVAAPDQATSFYSVDYTGAGPIFGPEMQQGLLVADEHGVWFGGSDGLYLYDATGFRKIAMTSGIPAGPCQ